MQFLLTTPCQSSGQTSQELSESQGGVFHRQIQLLFVRSVHSVSILVIFYNFSRSLLEAGNTSAPSVAALPPPVVTFLFLPLSASFRESWIRERRPLFSLFALLWVQSRLLKLVLAHTSYRPVSLYIAALRAAFIVHMVTFVLPWVCLWQRTFTPELLFKPLFKISGAKQAFLGGNTFYAKAVS